MTDAYLSLGSNIGDRRQNLIQAVQILAGQPGISVKRVSSLYETDPVGYEAQSCFLNLVVFIETDLTPDDLLVFCKHVENKMHRVETFRNGPRIIDLDLLLYGRIRLDTPRLTLPHPRMFDRAFVMIPLLEVMNPEMFCGTNHSSVRLYEVLEENFWLNGTEKGI